MCEFLSPQEQHTQARRTGELAELLSSFLAGQKGRADIASWTRAAWPCADQQGGPFKHHAVAATVFESIWNVEERRGDAYVVRHEDMAAYLDWLTLGDAFKAAPEPLVVITAPLDALTTTIRGTEVRMWLDGLGWQVTLRFASPATGRCFMANAPLEGEGACHTSIYTARADGPLEAAVDLIEALALDGSEVHWWLPRIQRAMMPRWSVWRQDDNGGRYEVAAFLSYSRAMRACEDFESRGHKQIYWVRQQGE